MNRRDPNAPRQQGGGYGYQQGGYQEGGRQEGGRQDSNRQAGQWQADPSQQAGGDSGLDWGKEQSPYRFSSAQDDYGAGSSRYEQQDRQQSLYGRGEREYRSGSQQPGSYGDRYSGGYSSGSYSGDFGSFTGNDFGGRDFSQPRSGFDRGTSSYGRSSFGGSSSDEYGSWRSYGESRGFFERAGDEIASWFGDEEAARRREQDHRASNRSENHRGRGPSDYTRSDDRIREDVNDKLTHDWRIDASHVRVSVKDGEVTLEGHVWNRQSKRQAEDVADSVSGVKHVQNNLRVQNSASGYGSTATATGTSDTTGGTGASNTGSTGIASPTKTN